MADATGLPPKSSADNESELRAANEIVYKHAQELARLTKELAEANASQESLLHFISHEIKGYLTKSEAAFAAIVEGDYGEAPPNLKTMAAGALGEMRRGVATIMDLLDASNLKKGTVTYTKKPFDFGEAVETVAHELRSAASQKSLALVLERSAGPLMVNGDKDKIVRHVIRNVVDNSIIYTEKGSITVELTNTDSMAQMSVQDTGVGITPDDMTRLFTQGGRGKDSLKINVHSTGHGLFIAKQIVAAHGGRIWAESEGAGKGARFIVQLPLA